MLLSGQGMLFTIIKISVGIRTTLIEKLCDLPICNLQNIDNRKIINYYLNNVSLFNKQTLLSFKILEMRGDLSKFIKIIVNANIYNKVK